MNPFSDLIPTKPSASASPATPASPVSSTAQNPFADLVPGSSATIAPTPAPKKNRFLNTVKTAAGGFASGVGGSALTAEDFLLRKGAKLFGSPQFQAKVDAMPKLNDQFRTEMGGDTRPGLFKTAQFGGEIAGLAAPVSTVGKGASKAAEAIGAGKVARKVAQAAGEGAAFTAGTGLTENKNQSLKDYAENIGLNVAIPIVGAATKSTLGKLPGRIINSLIGPGVKDFAYGKNPGEVVSRLVPSANTFDGLIANIKNTRQQVGEKIGAFLKSATVHEPMTAPINMEKTLAPIDKAIAEASKTPETNAAVISRLEATKRDLMLNLGDGSIDAAHGLLGTIGDITKWTGNQSDDKIVNKALKQTYGTVREQLDTKLQKLLTPEQFKEYKQAAGDYGSLISAQNAAEHRDKIIQKHNLISFTGKHLALLGALGGAIARGHVGVGTLLEGLGAAALDTAGATPAFKTRLAKLLVKLSPSEVQTFFDKVPTARNMFDKQEIDHLTNGRKIKFEGLPQIAPPTNQAGKVPLKTIFGGAAAGTAAVGANAIGRSLSAPKQIFQGAAPQPANDYSVPAIQDNLTPVITSAVQNAKKKYGVDIPPGLVQAIREQESSNIINNKNYKRAFGITDTVKKTLGKDYLPDTSINNEVQNAVNFLAVKSHRAGKDLSQEPNWTKWYVQNYVGLLPGQSRIIDGQRVTYDDIVNHFSQLLGKYMPTSTYAASK